MTYRFPLVLVWPRGAQIAAPEGQWRRLRSGDIQVTYRSRWELEVCLWFSDGDGQRELEFEKAA